VNRFHPQADAQLGYQIFNIADAVLEHEVQRLSLVESAANPGRQTRPHVAASAAQLRAPSHLTTYDTADSPERMLAARNVRNVASRDVSNLAAGVLGIIAN
jgi:hypothetical protein